MEQVIQQAATRRDTTAYEPRTRLRVKVRPTMQDIEGAPVPRGTHLVDVPASRVSVVKALAETDEDRKILELARASYQRELQAWLAKGLSESTFGGSVEAEFYKITKRSVPVLEACEVVEEGIAPPLTDEQRMTNGVLAQLIGLMQSPQAGAPEQRGKGGR